MLLAQKAHTATAMKRWCVVLFATTTQFVAVHGVDNSHRLLRNSHGSSNQDRILQSNKGDDLKCCSFDAKLCDSGWCGESQDNCEQCPNSLWLDVTGLEGTNCAALDYGCVASVDCCGNMQCRDENTCGFVTTTEESNQTGDAVLVFTDIPSGSPARLSPTLPPQTAPSTDTSAAPQLPNGPFIQAGYSEQVKIAQPEFPASLGAPRTNCPHQQETLKPWSFSPTAPETDVTLPENSRVLLSQSPGIRMGLITIPATSELVLGENSREGIELQAKGILVLGKLTAGSEDCRIETPITITLHGKRPADAVTSVPSPETKGIAVKGGIISLHGKRFYRTWTRLAKTVERGDRVLMLQDPINWQVGQQVVLVTTAMKDARDFHENDVVTIQYVYNANALPNGVGSAIVVDPPVPHRHVAIDNYQAEVGLLTRMIHIQGAEGDSEPNDPDVGGCAIDQFWDLAGDPSTPCTNREITGYGAHVIIMDGGKGFVEGVEFRRVGQTNVLGRYPMHFHLLGSSCNDCYVKDSSFHRSYYRCVSIHATNNVVVSENVAFDVTGMCYYLEDGVEVDNDIEFNLAAYIHMIGPSVPTGSGQTTEIYVQSDQLTLPADVAASGFYITNVHNNVIGNAASGGWSGFAFPNLPSPVGSSRNMNIRPSSATGLTLDGNTAHSSGWWFSSSGGFYFGGSLFYDDGKLTYNPGRSFNGDHIRSTCAVNFCEEAASCSGYCEPQDQLWIRMTNSKSFLNKGSGLNSWSGRMEIVGFEAHDNGLSLESLEAGFWIDSVLSVCRSGEKISLPPKASTESINGNGFFWYDTGQEHILTNIVFRNCGFRSSEYAQYDGSLNRGCGDATDRLCSETSTVFGFLTHSDTFNPEIMQGTRNISYESVGRRFYLYNLLGDDAPTSVSGRIQNWLDVDGSASGLNEPVLIGSGLTDCGDWWVVDDDVVHDSHGPLEFIQKNNGPERGIGHVHIEWSQALTDSVGNTVCGNGDRKPCPWIGSVRHRGLRFSNRPGLPMTANGDIAGPVGGYGWFLELDGGSPKKMTISEVEVDPETPLLFSVSYPLGTSFDIKYNVRWCYATEDWSCEETFQAVSTLEEVRNAQGNTYHVSTNGVLTFRIIQTAKLFTGNPDWFKPSWDNADRSGRGFALNRFERAGVRLPVVAFGPYLEIVTDCQSLDGVHCDRNIAATLDDVCPPGYEQVSYDSCCAQNEDCVYSNGSSGNVLVGLNEMDLSASSISPAYSSTADCSTSLWW